jgi:hypothetical protein
VVINHLQQRFRDDLTVGIACVYFNHKENMHTVDILGSLIKHLMQRETAVPEEIRQLYRKHMKNETRPTLTELSETLQQQSRDLKPFFVVVDALDECSGNGGSRSKFLIELGKLQTNLRIMFTGRPLIPSDSLKFQNPVRLELRARDEDIKMFVDAQIDLNDKLVRHVKKDEALRERIRDTITSKAKGMYLRHALILN